jgi:hypothetical protein
MASLPHNFKAPIDLIGINPFVFLPENILTAIFKQAGKEKGPIPVKGTVNNNPYKQTLIKYRGYWRLYINTTMLKDSPNRIGETIELTISFDPAERKITPHPKFIKALEENSEAKTVFDGLSPSKKHEIIRYISFLKTEKSIDKNIDRAIDFLLGNGKFVGRDKP